MGKGALSLLHSNAAKHWHLIQGLDFPEKTPSTDNPQLVPDKRDQCFHSFMHPSNMVVYHKKLSEIMLAKQYGMSSVKVACRHLPRASYSHQAMYKGCESMKPRCALEGPNSLELFYFTREQAFLNDFQHRFSALSMSDADDDDLFFQLIMQAATQTIFFPC